MENIRDGLCGRMCREQCQAQKDRILGQSLKKSAKSKIKPYIFLCLRRNGQPQEKLWEMIIPLPIEYSMRNTSESLKDAKESFLSQILQENVPEKYYLSQRACSGILRRASARGKGTAGTAETGIGETGTICLNDQGGERIDVTQDKTTTLRAQAHHPPCVMFENHSQDTRYIGPLEVSQTVLATFGTGGNNQPFVVHTPKTLKIRCGCDGGGKGALIQENKSATLSCNNDQTLFEPKVYGICSNDSNSMKSDNPNSGIYAADTSRTIDCGGVNPSSNQGGMAVVVLKGSMIGRKEKNGPNGSGFNQDTSFTLNTVDRHAVAYGIDRAAFNQGQNALYDFAIEKEKQPTMVAKGPGSGSRTCIFGKQGIILYKCRKECANTLVASDYKDPPLVNDTNGTEYIVRRLDT